MKNLDGLDVLRFILNFSAYCRTEPESDGDDSTANAERTRMLVDEDEPETEWGFLVEEEKHIRNGGR